jgi:hypothetical protein
MGMSEAEFFGQSIILWRRRMNGFAKFHGGGEAELPRCTPEELGELMARYPDEPAKVSALAAPAPTLAL